MSLPPFLRSTLLEGLGLEHGFGTRASARERVPNLLRARQVHGARVLSVPPLPHDAEADALLTGAPGQAVGIITADCVPILLAHESGAAVAVVHAGWRGGARRVAEEAARALAETTRSSPARLVAAIGPHIGPCCYEVDDPVREVVEHPSVFTPSERAGHYRMDLFELNRQQLLGVGLSVENIERVSGCTYCDPTRFFSYRREGQTGRLLHYVRRPEGSARP